MGASQNYNVNLNINANAQSAEKQLQNLQKQLQQISNMKVDIGVGNMTADIEKASEAAMKLSAHLATATNPQTGNLDFTKFYSSIQKSGASLQEYGAALQKMGPAGQKAFVSLADSISKAEIPLKRTSKMVDKMWDGFKRTAGWQVQSSVIHGIVGGVQQAVGYAKDLNESLTDIRIVTGQSTDQMAKFAKEANKAAKNLSTTTTDYTKASLIYYQQGLSDAEVKARTETTIKMANATGTSAQKVSDQMTAIWNNYDNGTKSLTHYADVMTALGAATASSTDEIAQGLQKFASISNTVGLSYEYAASALATITAESRESADVVGNALKTLFSRIQGLQLGETLDDGTTLNKYSTALAKVGISIKDQAGGLKDMDDILDEMGSKWQTLERDEKMALAQTVAGVRQYTQLMTLMENWDDFKTNLNTANTSAGTLDAQASIYADSWEAASNRVRASWEGLWDNLINSDSAIEVLNFISTFADGLDKIVSGLGGAKGVLTTFGGVLTKVFAPKLSQTIADTAYNIKMMMPGAESRMIKERERMITNLQGALSSGHLDIGTAESNVRNKIVEARLKESQERASRQATLTGEEKIMYDAYSSQLELNREAQVKNAQEIDAAANKRADLAIDEIGSANLDKDYFEGGKKYRRIVELQERIEGLDPNLQQAFLGGENLEALEKQYDSISREKGQTRRQKINATVEQNQKFLDSLSSVESAEKAIEQFINATVDGDDEAKRKKFADIHAGLKEYTSDEDKLNYLREKARGLTGDNRDRVIADMDVIGDEKGLTLEELDKEREKYRKYFDTVAEIAAKKSRGEQLSEQEQAILDQQSKLGSEKANWSDTFVGVSQGLMSTAAAMSALEGLNEQIEAVANGAGSLTGVLSALGSLTMNSAMAFNGLKTAMEASKLATGAAAGWWAAGIMAAIALAAHVIEQVDKNNISEKERIKTLQQSDAEIKNANESTKLLIDTYQTQNDNYTQAIEKIKTQKSTPEELVNDVFAANTQALELISQYGLTADEYTKASTGLIEIDQEVLNSKVEQAEQASQDLTRTAALSGLTTTKETAKNKINDILSENSAQAAALNILSFEDAMKAYGTEKWSQAESVIKGYAGSLEILEQIEEAILEYQNASNMLDLAARNNVDYLLRSQEYTLKGSETFAALGYKSYKDTYNETYEKGKFSGTNESDLLTDKNKKRVKEYLEAQGYVNVTDIDFDGSDVAKFTFKHGDGETGDTNVEAVRKWDAEQHAADVTESTFSQQLKVLQSLYTNQGDAVAPGLMSFLTGGNFENATQAEIKTAQDALEGLMKEFRPSEGEEMSWELYDKKIKEIFGITTQEFQDLFGINFAKTHINDLFSQFKNFKTSAQQLFEGELILDNWLNEKDNQGIVDNLTQSTLTSLYDSFKKASLLGGEESGEAMLKGITEVLQDSNLDNDQLNAAVQGLLAIDWSNTFTSGGAAAEVIRSLGGELDTTTDAWQAFAAAMGAAAGAMPDFSKLISQLTQLAGALQGLAKGGSVDAAVRDQLVGMNSELAYLFSKHWSGNYTFIGDDVKSMTGMIWDKMDEEKVKAGDVQKAYDDYLKNGGKNQKDNDQINIDDFTQFYDEESSLMLYDENSHAMKLANLAGYDNYSTLRILENYKNANQNASSWNSKHGKMVNGSRVRIGENGEFEVQQEDGTWEEEIDQMKIDRYGQRYKADQTEYNTSKSVYDTLMDGIHGLDEISGEWKPEEIEEKVSAASSLSEVLERVRNKQSGLTETNGEMTKSTEKGVLAWAAQNEVSERTTNAIKELLEANKNLREANEEDEPLAKKIQEEALAYAELQANIDEVAAVRGLDADLLAQQVSMMKKSEEGQYHSAESITIMAAENLELIQSLQDLNKNYKTLSKSLKQNKRDSENWLTSMSKLKKSLGTILNIDGSKLSDDFVLAAESSGLIEKALSGQAEDLMELRRAYSLTEAATKNYGKTNEEVNNYIKEHGLTNIGGLLGENGANLVNDWNTIVEGMKTMDWDEILNNQGMQSAIGNVLSAMTDLDSGTQQTLSSITQAALGQGFKPVLEPVPVEPENGTITVPTGGIYWYGDANDPSGQAGVYQNTIGSESVSMDAAEGSTLYKISFAPLSGSASPSGGGGGGGSKPKKAANKRKSQTVKRYKQVDNKRTNAQSAKGSASTKKDYLYGESKIAQMEKINKLAEKEARITSDRIKESRKYMIEDRENLIKYMQKYGYEVEFDADGFLTTYEEAWTKIHDKIAKLYADNEITDSEKELEEQYNIELEELEGALEDYENSLNELQADIEAYEESLYEMYDNKVEQMQHKVEFRIELNEDDLSYLDFWIEALGDSLYNALQSIQTMGEKTDVLFDGINTYKQGIEDIYALSDDPLHTWATGGIDEVLTQDQIDALRENKDGLMDYMQQLIDLRSTIQDKVIDTFDKWQEKLQTTLDTIEHYGTVMEHFKNIIDIVGKDSLKLNNQFMSNLQQTTINQSMDNIEATKAHYDSLVQTNAEAQKNLEEAIASGDQTRIEFWEEVVKTTNEEMQSAQDTLLSSLENTLNLIVEKFETAMEYAAEKFNEAIYAYGGLEGLQNDYELMREQADLIAEDYDKIYQLNKINRNINRTLSDSNIIAGKQKMKALQQEINALQASGVELSKYDLEYLQAKYELRLAEIELENAKNNKDTVRLSKDSEGNWSYIYTSSVDKVEEAQQKYEDALYNMQNLSYEYMEEMSSAMIATSLAMMEEIQALRIQDFNSYEEYESEIERIQNKYAVVLKTQQDELNKTVINNEQLYDEDWKNYSKATGYKISESELWADKYSETTLGTLLGSSETVADFASNILQMSDVLLKDLGNSAIEYFANVDTAMNKYGTSIDNFGTHVSTTVSNISTQSKTAAEDMKDMAKEMSDAFKEVTDYVSSWQEEFSQQISDMLAEIGTLIQSINEAIQTSAEFAGGSGAEDLIGSAEAVKLLNNHADYNFGEWGFKGNQLVVDGKATSFVEENAKLINEINDKMIEYTNAETGSEEREKLGIELEALFKKYHAFKDIVGRIYDPTTLSAMDLEKPTYVSMDTGGYTGSWGASGKFAMLHEKELILNQNDTKNFLDALNISRDVINRMIEMNARESSMAFGNLIPASLKEFGQSLEQQVSIVAEFPNATDHDEIEEAFNNLINKASQYAHKYKD